MMDILLSPRRAFAKMDGVSRKTATLAYILIVFTICTLLAIYFHVVDMHWLQGKMLERLNENQRAMASKLLTPDMLLFSTVGGRVLKITIWLAFQTFYFDIVRRGLRSDVPTKRWIQLVLLAHLPLVAMLPLGLFAIFLLQPVQLLPSQLDTTSLAFVFSGSHSARWEGPLSQVSLIQIWIVGIEAVAVRAWLNISSGKALAIAAAPSLVFLILSVLVAIL